MKKLIRIIACLAVLATISLGTQSFMSPSPAPNYTVVEIEHCPGDYAVKVNMVGLWYDDPLYTVFCINNIIYSPSGTETFNADKKFWYSYGCDAFQINVYVKEYSNSDWDWVGAINTDNPNATLTVASNFLQKFSVDYYDFDNP